MKQASWAPVPETLRPGFKAYRLIDGETGRGLARLGLDPHDPQRPCRLQVWVVEGVCLSSSPITLAQATDVLATLFYDYDLNPLPTGSAVCPA